MKLARRQDDAKADRPAPARGEDTGGVSRRAVLQASAGAVAGTAISAAAGPLPAIAGGGPKGGDHSHGGGYPGLIQIPPPKINAAPVARR